MSPVTRQRGVIAAGHWIVDVSKRINRWPEPETLAVIENLTSTNGGAAFNVSCDLARLDPDLPIQGIGLIGTDSPGHYVIESCAALGIDTTGLARTDAAPTSFTDVMTERESGRRTFFHAPGTMDLLDESHFDLANGNAGIFFLAYLGLMPRLDALGEDGANGASRLFRQASGLGMLTAADLVSAPNEKLAEQVAPCLPELDLLFSNEWEAERLLGKSLAAGKHISFGEAAALARGVVGLGLRGRAIVHFPGGAVCAEPSGEVHALGAVRVPREEIVGTTGAGDAFSAGFLMGICEGMASRDCLELAVSCAAISLHSITCSDAIRPWRECLAYAQTRGFAEAPSNL